MKNSKISSPPASLARRIGSLVYHSLVTPEEKANWTPKPGWAAPLPKDFARHMEILADMGANPITYDQLYDWHRGMIELPAGSLTIDFDNVHISQYRDAYPVLQKHGWVANLMVNTEAPTTDDADPSRYIMTWKEISKLHQQGWGICSHTHTHKQMSLLADQDPTGGSMDREFTTSIKMIEKHVGITTHHFAYVGRGWNELAESIVKRYFRTARLWVANMPYLLGGGKEIPVGEILGAGSRLEVDAGPPVASRYLTRQSNPLRVPGVDACNLPFTTEGMRSYLSGLFQ